MTSWESLLYGLDSAPVQLLEHMPAWVQLSQSDGTIEMVNEAACRISGCGRFEMIGQTWPYPWFLDNWSCEGGNPLDELTHTGKILASEVTCVNRHGEHRVLSVTMSLLSGETSQSKRVLMVAQDITERKRWEEGLVQAERIRVVSQLVLSPHIFD